MLGLGRAMGETIAVALIFPATFGITLRDPRPRSGNSIAANIANGFGEATPIGRGALIASGLVLFVITLLVNMAARLDHRPPQGVREGRRMTAIQHISTGRAVQGPARPGAWSTWRSPRRGAAGRRCSGWWSRTAWPASTWTSSPTRCATSAPRDAGGGAYHAIIGTLEQVLLASLISVPIGLLTAIYLVEYGNGGRLSRAISFFVDVMTGIPSVVAGLFILAFWILAPRAMPFSGFAGALALSILMMPTVVRSAEEMLRLVPNDLREASYALGVPKWRTIIKVVLPTAFTGIATGVMLAVARVAGETAPLLLTVFFTDSINNDPFNGPQMGLAALRLRPGGRPTDTAIDRAWAGALTLILIVMLLNLVARLIGWWRSPARGR